VATAAPGRMPAIPPRAWCDRQVVLATEPLSRRWNFETKHATLISIPGPPPAPEDRTPMFFAEAFLGRWHFSSSIAFAASRGAMASEPIARSDRLAVNLAKTFLGRG